MVHTRFERMVMHLVRSQDGLRDTKIVFQPATQKHIEIYKENQSKEERIEMFKILLKYLGRDEFYDLWFSLPRADHDLISDHVFKESS